MKRFVILLASAIVALGACGKIRPAPGSNVDGLCGDSLLACDSQCVDPSRDPEFCGAVSDCAGVNAGKICAEGTICQQGLCVDPPPTLPGEVACINCSFETGDLTGWVTRDVLEPEYPLSVAGLGATSGYGFFTSMPTDGSLALVTGFDGRGPGVISASQILEIPASAKMALKFDYRAAWDLTYGAMRDRTFSVVISKPDGQPILVDTVLTATANTRRADTGLIPRTVDLGMAAGQKIELEFLWDVPEAHTGPGFFQIDNVRIVPQ